MIQDEQEAIKYLISIRWGKMASCPHCDNSKAYFIENGKRFKCANKLCYKKFSVTTKTLMESTNIPLSLWIKSAELFVTKRGEVEVWDIEKAIGVKKMTAAYMKDKFEMSWKYVLKEAEKEELIKDLFVGLINLYDKYQSTKRVTVLTDVNDISDIRQYRKVEAYTKYILRRYHWIKTNQFSETDIITETFLYMADNGIKEYNDESIAFLIRKTTNRLWMDWVYSHPNTYEYFLSYQREYQRKARLNLQECYLNNKLKRRFPDKMMSEISSDTQLQKIQKERIIEFRNKYKLMEEFNSHFD